ncbi:MAG: prepilin-type N-terminal cleavage/methylation domain-containing protein [Fuerstiella sp.]
MMNCNRQPGSAAKQRPHIAAGVSPRNSVSHDRSAPYGATAASRSGVTLVEVLMALMIMSIGVSAVAVLFPISVLRSIQATQLTNAAIVKLNLETLVDVQPELIFDPDGDYNPSASLAARRATLEEHFRAPASRNYIVDPVGFYTHLFDGNPAAAAMFGNDGTAPAGAITRFGGGITLTNGRNINRQPPPLTANELAALRLKALALANQGDGWETQIDAQPGALVAGGVRISTDLDLTQVPTAQLVLPPDGSGGYLLEDPELYRIVMFSLDGKFSQALPLTAIDTTNNIAFYTEDTNGNGNKDAGEDVNMNGVLDVRTLPTEFGGIVSRVLLQSRKISDYSWMLNVRRRGDGQARSVDVVVRFSDGVSLTDERLFEATFVPSTAASTSRFVWVRKPIRSNPTDTTEPNIRKGKFIFDAFNGIWYRIQDVQERPTFGTGNPNWMNFDYLVTVEQAIGANAGAGTLAGAGPFGAAMFPTGIVDVYPMGSRNLPDDMQVPTF